MPNFTEEFRVLGAEACRSVIVLVSAIIRSPGPPDYPEWPRPAAIAVLPIPTTTAIRLSPLRLNLLLESRISQLGRRLKEFHFSCYDWLAFAGRNARFGPTAAHGFSKMTWFRLLMAMANKCSCLRYFPCAELIRKNASKPVSPYLSI